MTKYNLDKNKRNIKEICEICGDTMYINTFAYDYDSENKLVFKCSSCGHRKVKNL